MNAGLPGAGIGSAFYLLSALWMPFHEIHKTLRTKSQPQRTRLIFVQSSIALGIIAGIWLMGWLLGEMLVRVDKELAFEPAMATSVTRALPNVIKVTMVFMTVGLLAVVVGGVHLLKLVVRYHKARQGFNGRIDPATVPDSRRALGEMPHARDATIEKVEVAG